MNFSHFPKVVGPASAKGEKRGERGLEIKYRHFKWETAQLLIPTSNETKKTNQDDDGGRGTPIECWSHRSIGVPKLARKSSD